MTDEEFLGYVEIHSETPRALFSAEMIERLYDLAGQKVERRPVRPALPRRSATLGEAGKGKTRSGVG